jgi:linoleate 8R-lipoxygenase/9,12-octadecadienoate 8-hydroperoxide 8R-isomerase/linoleate 8R-lipoxygenase/9,12-octadecadienoate 8-hydroperoxide 8S-isomerase
MSENGTPKTRKRPGLSTRLSSAAKAIQRSFSPIPKYSQTPGNTKTEETTGIVEDLKRLGFEDIDTLLQFLNASIVGVQDDSDLILEHLIQLFAKLPPTSQEGKNLEDGFIHRLWSSLDHPPVSSLGEAHKYREPDGSNNNVYVPRLGAANTPYGRTTPPMTYQNPNQPDPGVVFDTLMSRGSTFHPHPNKISSVLFYLATLIIHDVFQTVRPLDPALATGRLRQHLLTCLGWPQLQHQQDLVVP